MSAAETAINPMNPDNWDKPVWLVYGHKCFPQMLCAKLSFNGAVNIWGYSVYKRKAGFRTLGREFQTWASEHAMCFVFGEQQHALDYLKEITTPKVKA